MLLYFASTQVLSLAWVASFREHELIDGALQRVGLLSHKQFAIATLEVVTHRASNWRAPLSLQDLGTVHEGAGLVYSQMPIVDIKHGRGSARNLCN